MFTLFSKSLCFALTSIGILCIALTANCISNCIASSKEKWTNYYKLLSETNTTDIMADLDDFIFSIFENYTRLNVGVYNNYIDLTPEKETQISKDVSELVIVCMSRDFREKLGIVFADEMINEIITKHVMVFTTTFVLESKK